MITRRVGLVVAAAALAKKFRVWAGCVGSKIVYGPWKAVTYAQSVAPGCSRGIQNGGKRYSYDLSM